MIFTNSETKTLFYASKENPRNSEASVIQRNDSSLLLIYQHYYDSPAGSQDAAPNSLNAVVSFDDGKSWEQERVLVKTPDGCRNVYSPNLFLFQDGAIGLIHMICKETLRSIIVIRSEDEGETFSEYSSVVKDEILGISNDCLRRLSTGRLLLPTTFTKGVWPNDYSMVRPLYSDDDGKTWQLSQNAICLPMRGAMEPFVAETVDGKLMMVVRNQLGSLFLSVSSDFGQTWTKPQTTGLSVPESCPFLIRIPNSAGIIIGWNNSEYDMHWASHYGKRTPFTLAVTYDGGETFEDFYNIETDPTRAFSNPSGIWISDSKLLMTYWSCKYAENGSFGGPIDLKQAVINIDRDQLKL